MDGQDIQDEMGDAMAMGDNFGVLLPTRGVLVYAGSGGPRVEQTLADGRDRRAGGVRLGLGRGQHHVEAAHGATDGHGRRGRGAPAGSRWAPPCCSMPCVIPST